MGPFQTDRVACCVQAGFHSVFGAFTGPVILVICAGPRHPADISEAAALVGVRMLASDVKLGGWAHDLHRPSVRGALIELCAQGWVAGAHFGTDCASFSPLNAEFSLRVPPDADGKHAPPQFARYIERQNDIIRFCVGLAAILLQKGRVVTWENPPDLGEEGRPWHWQAMAGAVSPL